MAESVIKSSEGVVIVASSGTTNESYSAKLNKLLSAYNNMTPQQKMRAFIATANSVYSIANTQDGLFVSTSSSLVRITIATFNITSKTVYYSYVYPSSVVSLEDHSSDVISNNVQLGYYV